MSFPIPLRYWINTNKKLFTTIYKIIIKQIHRLYINKAKAIGINDPKPGAISFTQRWGSALNLNPHLHILCLDGVYVTPASDSHATPHFRNVASVTDREVQELITVIAVKVMKHLQKTGHLSAEGEMIQNPTIDPLFAEHESLTAATTASIAGKIAFGPNAGKYVIKIGSGFGFYEEIPLAKGPGCYSINGFSLHANTCTKAHDRERLYKLIEYIARGPLSNERLEITDSGQVKLRLKTKWSDGTSHLLLTPGEFLEKLSALVPLPKSHLVKWSGVFAPNSPIRKLIILKPKVKKGFQFEDDGKKKKNFTWSKMLAKAFKFDVTKCDKCGGKLKSGGRSPRH